MVENNSLVALSGVSHVFGLCDSRKIWTFYAKTSGIFDLNWTRIQKKSILIKSETVEL